MSSRDDILTRVRRQSVEEIAPPVDFSNGIVYDDPLAQFASVLEAVGGRLEQVASASLATAFLETVPEYSSGESLCSCVPLVGRSTFDLADVADPHDLRDVDFAVLPGELMVAENGAIWVTTGDVCVRTLYFLTQHLAIVVSRRNIVSNMHQAYARTTVDQHAFGTWISGPSKTADIEQSLVKGAHGSRTLLVLAIDD